MKNRTEKTWLDDFEITPAKGDPRRFRITWTPGGSQAERGSGGDPADVTPPTAHAHVHADGRVDVTWGLAPCGPEQLPAVADEIRRRVRERIDAA